MSETHKENEMPKEIFAGEFIDELLDGGWRNTVDKYCKTRYLRFDEHERICDNMYDSKLKEKDDKIKKLEINHVEIVDNYKNIINLKKDEIERLKKQLEYYIDLQRVADKKNNLKGGK